MAKAATLGLLLFAVENAAWDICHNEVYGSAICNGSFTGTRM